ncbi:type VI secretion system protein ImpC [Bosea sp. OK403]|jgi:type VI secretion system protein ImpC|uniref:type VI secretion system contractile sheath large subunit n=1 Tax=unclassified Bosea (in: a-proteobacteria) TaxID=2653178 RepID=UPI0008E19ECD|nr:MULTISPECIES: type VI secretion system contractile sheath large subunit [unclassified Bosea (in: a-proteobacteria)]MDR6871070.1 type VI secretion system protein ImpC [Bosea sp. BE125]SFH93866.1 type VI secretion system protein ImpC [Bosea sp. OK403]
MATELKSATQTGQTETRDVDEFASLLKQSFKPRSERAATEVENAVSTLVQQALADQSLVKDDVLDTIEEMIAQLDKKLSEQVNAIIHAPEFQQIESAWRGLNYLIMNSETDVQLKIRVMNISKNELSRTLKLYPGAKWDQSPLFKKVYEHEFGQLGGEPYGCLIGDYYFSHLPQDVQLLRDISKVAASAHAPFFAAAGPTLMGMDSWNELANPRDLGKIFDTPDYAAWRSLRDSDDSCYAGLCMPRVLSRLPYGAKSDPVEEFGFEEETDGHTGSNYAWMNASYAMAVNINRAFKEWGWCTRIRGVQSGGEVINLPTHTFPSDDGGVDLKCPTEIAISDRREAELAKAGLIPLIHRKNSDKAAFIGAQSLYKPKKYDNNVDATASSNLRSRLPYMFAVSRFAHYLKCMVRDKVGSTMEQEQLTVWLQEWINQYVDGAPATSTEQTKARKPLAAASVQIRPDEENPGYYSARFLLRPHYQLEGMDVSLSLVSRLPQKS